MKSTFSHFRLLLTALVLAAVSLLASAGSAGADELAGARAYTSPAAVHDALISDRLIEECVVAAMTSDKGCAAEHGVCCSNVGSGCCATCGVCGARPMLTLIELARNHPGLPTILALGSIDPQANRRPPKRLA